MSEYPKFIPGEEIVGTIEFREMEPGVDYVIVEHPFRNRVVTLSPAPEFEPVKVDFFPDEEGSRLADIRELTRWGLKSQRGEDLTEHDLAALLIKNGVIPFVSHDILLPVPIPEPAPEEVEQKDPTDPMTHIGDYFPHGIPARRGMKK